MALTLIEAAKLHSGNVEKSAVIEQFARSSDLMAAVPFENIPGNALSYNMEGTLPGVAFRGVNESYTESTGIINPQTEALVIAGGDLDVDKFIVDTMGMDQRSVQEMLKVKALSLTITNKFIKGDSTSDPREFDGLQVRCTGNQLIAAGSTANGTALSLAKMDDLIDAVDNPSAILMNKTLIRRLAAAARSTSVAGYLTYTIGAFGQRVTAYNGIPIIPIDKDEAGNVILPFTEACTSGTATGTSIYCVSFGDGAVQGIQNGVMDVRDLGEIQTKPVYRTRVEWYMGMVIYSGRAAARMYSIADGAVTA
jgi:hypothetical protein